MPKYFAFLRAINVGGHIVKMDQLRKLFEELGFENVETFIASGNVIFDTRKSKTLLLENKIEQHLHQQLGYQSTTFIRSVSELAAVADHKPFADSELEAKQNTLFVGFLSTEPPDAAKTKLKSLKNQFSDFHVNGRELYWLRRRLPDEPPFSSAPLEKTLGMAITFRNINTVKRLVSKYS
ncbi:MAG TPA: DUF1697 domain-containing protein [Pyrinomonadaceae bacterium]